MALYYFHHQYSCGPKGRYYTVDDAGSELPGLYEARELAFELARKEALESPAGNSRIVVTDRTGKTLLTIYSSDWIAPPPETQEVVLA